MISDVYRLTWQHDATAREESAFMAVYCRRQQMIFFNPLNVKLNPVCLLLPLLAAHHILHLSRIRVNTESKKWGADVDWLEFILWLLNLSKPS